MSQAITNTIDRLIKKGQISQAQQNVVRHDIVDQNRLMREYLAGRIKSKPAIKDYIKRVLTVKQLAIFKESVLVEAFLDQQDKAMIRLNDRFSKAV